MILWLAGRDLVKARLLDRQLGLTSFMYNQLAVITV